MVLVAVVLDVSVLLTCVTDVGVDMVLEIPVTVAVIDVVTVV